MSEAERIESLYATSLNGAFPYADCFRLLEERNDSREALIPDLDWYFATIAGYSSRASQLITRSATELDAAENLLSKSFYEHFPELESYRALISEEGTPELYKRLEVTEKLRLGLLNLVHPRCVERV